MKEVTLVGIGMGNPDTLTLGGLKALQNAKLLIGAKRILASLPQGCDGQKVHAIAATSIAETIRASHLSPVAVVLSGDTGFYSGAKKLPDLLPDCDVKTLPGITTVQYFSAKLQRPWQDVILASAHGMECNIFAYLLQGKEVFFLTGGTVTPLTMAHDLCQAGLGETMMHIGENLSYDTEKITSLPAYQVESRTFATLSSVWVEAIPRPYGWLPQGIDDQDFIRGDIPMTKQEVRSAILAKLKIAPGDVVYDIGAGTGSVSMEMALCHPSVQVFAVECVPAACDLILENRTKFGAYNVTLLQAKAPQGLADLPAPQAVFVGGSRGNLQEILQTVLAKNPLARVCISAIAVETVAEATQALKSMNFVDFEVCQITVARGRKAGPYHLMTGQNPIFLLSATGGQS